MLVKRNYSLLAFPFLVTALLSGCSGNRIQETDPHDDSLLLGHESKTSSTKIKHSNIPEAEPFARAPSTKVPLVKATYQTNPAPDRKQNSRHDTWDRVFQGFRLGNHVRNPRVRTVIHEYARKPEKLTSVAKRSAPYLHMIISEVERRGMPAEVALLPFVESGFNPKAYSHSGAAGLWQFIPSTGKAYGLPRSNSFDARLDPFAATGAALNYLQKLNRQFKGDWLLTFAAYNAGGGKVSRTIAKFKRRHPGQRVSFWALDLPTETMRYVPKLLAYKEVLLNSNRYGYRLPHIPNTPHLIQVRVDKPLNLRLVASRAGLPNYALTDLNPYFLRGVTIPGRRNRIVLPRRYADQINKAIRSLPPAYVNNSQTAKQRYARINRKDGIKYTVRKGDSLHAIAKLHGVPEYTIISLNQKRSAAITIGETLNIS